MGKPAEKEEDGEKKDSELESAMCLHAIDKFKEAYAPALQKDEEVAKHAKNMPRAFCVMVYEESFDVTTGKSSIDWKNYRVLVGKQEAIDAVKKSIENIVPSDGYEVVLRENPI